MSDGDTKEEQKAMKEMQKEMQKEMKEKEIAYENRMQAEMDAEMEESSITDRFEKMAKIEGAEQWTFDTKQARQLLSEADFRKLKGLAITYHRNW